MLQNVYNMINTPQFMTYWEANRANTTTHIYDTAYLQYNMEDLLPEAVYQLQKPAFSNAVFTPHTPTLRGIPHHIWETATQWKLIDSTVLLPPPIPHAIVLTQSQIPQSAHVARLLEW